MVILPTFIGAKMQLSNLPFKPYLLFALVATIVVGIWFSSHRLIAVGEEGIWMYNPQTALHHYLNYWNEIGLGRADPVVLPRTTQLWAFSQASHFLAMWQVQALSFWLLIFTGLSGCFLLLRRLIVDSDWLGAVGSLFYFFNLYSLSQIWGRYISAEMFTWAYLPWFLWIWVMWLDTGRKKFLGLFIISNIVFANAFGNPVFIFTFFLPVGLYTLLRLRPSPIKTAVRAMVAAVGWLLIHVVWLYPFVVTSATSLSRSTGWLLNFESLHGVSQYFGIDQLLLLRQGFLFSKYYFLYDFYILPSAILGSIILLVVVIVGIMKGRTTFYRRYFVYLFLLGLFICKGTQAPFGIKFYQLAFKYFSPFMLLRNPYEKFGPAYLLAYTAVFAIGFSILTKRSKKIAVVVLGLMAYLSWPMWTGIMHKGRQVMVPDYYQTANDFFNRDPTDFRVLVMPIIPGEAVRYLWPQGNYEGAEPSEFLLDKNTLARSDYSDANYKKFFELHDTFVANANPLPLFDQLGIKYLIVRHDQDYAFSSASTSAQVQTTLAKYPDVQLVSNFGQLTIYKYLDFKPMVDIQSPNSITFTVFKSNPSKYVVSLQAVTAPFKLILKQAYSPLWIAKIEDQKLADHYLAFDYANGWSVDKKGDFQIEISFDVW